jgi:hypothetical protein
MTTHEVTCWLQVKPEWTRYVGGHMQLKGVKAVKVTQRPPDPPLAGCDVVKLTLRIPTSRLLPLAPDPIDLPEHADLSEVYIDPLEEPGA